MTNIHFEWDEAKAASNMDKHGVSFIEAMSVFLDSNALVVSDPDHSQDEDRFLLLGMSGSPRLLVVVHCFRSNEESIRIISARKASRQETMQYQGG